MAIVRADQVFTTAAGFTADELERIQTAGAGRTVAFKAIPNSEFLISNQRGNEEMLTEFARGKTAEEVAKAHGMSRRRFFYLLKKEREEGMNAERMKSWQERGLSLREIGRLMGRSHEAVRRETQTNTD
jgi:hypothetical protein